MSSSSLLGANVYCLCDITVAAMAVQLSLCICEINKNMLIFHLFFLLIVGFLFPYFVVENSRNHSVLCQENVPVPAVKLAILRSSMYAQNKSQLEEMTVLPFAVFFIESRHCDRSFFEQTNY